MYIYKYMYICIYIYFYRFNDLFNSKNKIAINIVKFWIRLTKLKQKWIKLNRKKKLQ